MIRTVAHDTCKSTVEELRFILEVYIRLLFSLEFEDTYCTRLWEKFLLLGYLIYCSCCFSVQPDGFNLMFWF